MKVGVDLRTVKEGMTGVGQYTWRLTRALLKSRSDHEVHVFLGKRGVGPWLEQARDLGARAWTWTLSTESHPWCDLWEQTVLPLWLEYRGFDLFLSGTFLLPWWSRKVRRVFVVHDMIAFLFPETMPNGFAAYSRWCTRWSSKRSDRIIVNSLNTMRDLERFVPETKGKTVLVYAGLEDRDVISWKEGLDSDGTGNDFMREPFFLSVGTDPRKNLSFLVEVYLEARQSCPDLPKLVLVGGETKESGKIREQLRRRSAQEYVEFVGYLSARQLAEAYARAYLFLFPSLYEGFGYPPLEAMKARTPVITSNRGSMAEVVADAGLLLDPRDRSGWRESMVRLWLDREYRESWVVRGMRRAGEFSTERTCRMILDALEGWR